MIIIHKDMWILAVESPHLHVVNAVITVTKNTKITTCNFIIIIIKPVSCPGCVDILITLSSLRCVLIACSFFCQPRTNQRMQLKASALAPSTSSCQSMNPYETRLTWAWHSMALFKEHKKTWMLHTASLIKEIVLSIKYSPTKKLERWLCWHIHSGWSSLITAFMKHSQQKVSCAYTLVHCWCVLFLKFHFKFINMFLLAL